MQQSFRPPRRRQTSAPRAQPQSASSMQNIGARALLGINTHQRSSPACQMAPEFSAASQPVLSFLPVSQEHGLGNVR